MNIHCQDAKDAEKSKGVFIEKNLCALCAFAVRNIKTLKTRRFALLNELRHRGPLSIRALADVLERDYKNVHTDVNALAHVGLIEITKDGRFLVPWDRIATEIELAA